VLIANKSILENVNDKSDLALVRGFSAEYSKIINDAKASGQSLHLLDILVKLFFIDPEMVAEPNFDDASDRYRRLNVLLRGQGNNIQVVSPSPNHPEDIQKNLLKVLCAVMNLRTNQRGGCVLDGELLEQYTEQISTNRFEDDNNFLRQIAVLKSLINRKAYAITDQQVSHIHKKFKNMHQHRKKAVYTQRKKANEEKLQAEMRPSFKPKLVARQSRPTSGVVPCSTRRTSGSYNGSVDALKHKASRIVMVQE